MKNFKVGLQLYSIRQDMEKNMDEALKKVKDMGYDYVEFAGYFGHTSGEVREMLKRHGIECISVHQNPTLFWEQGQAAIDYIKEIGARFCAIPHYDKENFTDKDKWNETVKRFTDLGRNLKKNGIQLMYHNHDFEFEKVDGEFILDRIYAAVPSDLLQPQIDTCWVHYAGFNPVDYVLKYSGRISVLHLKDFVCTNLGSGPVYSLIGKDGKEGKKPTREENGFAFKPLGKGIQDIPKILEAAEKAGAEYLIVEQDESVDIPPIEAARISREYLKGLGI